MALIAIAQNRRMSDYMESVRRAGGEPIEVAAGGELPEHLLARSGSTVRRQPVHRQRHRPGFPVRRR